MKRCIFSILFCFIFVIFFNWFFHGQILAKLYNETPQLWRSAKEMQALRWFSWLSGMLLVAVVGYFFAIFYQGRGLGEGVNFGLTVGALIGVVHFASFAYLPISLNLALAWLFGAMVKGLGLGVILSLVWGDRSQ